MKILILGDVHGQWEHADRTISIAREKHPDIDHIFQVGDLGDGWPTRQGLDRWNPKTAGNIPIHWCPGNHDNYDAIENRDFNERLTFQDFASVLNIEGINFMFLGGGTSIDKRRRIPHLSWWPQESISQKEATAALEVDVKIDVVISHERPGIFPFPEGFELMEDGECDRTTLSEIQKKHNPAYWIHGHHHWRHSGVYGSTEYHSMPDIRKDVYDYAIFDGSKLTCSWKS